VVCGMGGWGWVCAVWCVECGNFQLLMGGGVGRENS
jgi:hypothetical protein